MLHIGTFGAFGGSLLAAGPSTNAIVGLRMSDLSPAALIEAADQVVGRAFLDVDEQLSARVLDAVVPLIADAIEADAHALKHRITAASADLGRPLARTMLSEVDGRILAARLVRSLLGTDSPATVSLPSSPPALPETGE